MSSVAGCRSLSAGTAGPRHPQRPAAGLDVTTVAGDATRLPILTDTQNVVTARRVLHDLPVTDQPKALEELHRIYLSSRREFRRLRRHQKSKISDCPSDVV
ncbi:class I SAM-dependent methyltransferase [Haloterrigena sp. H1]|uniref:class I SAM-dependent methyltransferase n=1 Tax=Haloterrigena sp. H1 TaxID=2552943 RepID=UPI001487588D|nr:class I SAM-dependent methyltransferase [Haloterrigena sp. H1]